MRFMRSMRNPSTKAGGTSNTTGSRIRSSARTIREGTVSLVQKARAKVGGAGYAHGASSNKGVKGSAGQIKQTAANQSKKAGDTLKQTRRNTVSALKSAPAPQGSSTRYAAGYRMGTNQAAKSYKSNVAANNPGRRTGLESRTLTQATAAIIQGKRAALRGSMAAASLNRTADNIVSGGAKLGMRAERVASAVGNAPRAALSATTAKGKTFAQGVRMGSRMPDASLSKVYSAQRYADPKGIDKSVTRVSHATAMTTAAGYGVGKAARRTVQGVNAVQDAPGNAVRAMFSSSRKAAVGLIGTAGKVAGGLVDAARNNRLSLGTQNAMHNTVRPGVKSAMRTVKPGVKSAVESFNRGAEKVFMGIGKGVGYAAAAPSLAVYHGGKALVGGIKANMAASARMKVASASAMNSPRMTRAAGFGQVGKTTPLGRNSIVQAVRVQNVQSGGVYMGKRTQHNNGKGLKKAWNLSSNGTVGGSYGQPHPLRQSTQAPSVQTKQASSGSLMGQASGRGQAMVGTPKANPVSRLQRTAPWQSGSGLTARMSGSKRRIRVAPPTVPLPPKKTVVREILGAGNAATGSRSSFTTKETQVAKGFSTTAMDDRVKEVVGKARAARGNRPATVGEVKFKGPQLMKGERGTLARHGVNRAAEKKYAHENRFSLNPATSKPRGRPRKAGK